MAEQAKEQPKVMKRCGERVKFARVDIGEVSFCFPEKAKTLEAGKNVDVMALHPWGLFVLIKGERFVLPHTAVKLVMPADEEQ